MTLTKWNPGRDYLVLQDRINRLFSDAYGGEEGLMNKGTWIPPVDIFQNGKDEPAQIKKLLSGLDINLDLVDASAEFYAAMKGVTEPGKFANWIAAPARGVNGQPVDFEYVRLA